MPGGSGPGGIGAGGGGGGGGGAKPKTLPLRSRIPRNDISLTIRASRDIIVVTCDTRVVKIEVQAAACLTYRKAVGTRFHKGTGQFRYPTSGLNAGDGNIIKKELAAMSLRNCRRGLMGFIRDTCNRGNNGLDHSNKIILETLQTQLTQHCLGIYIYCGCF